MSLLEYIGFAIQATGLGLFPTEHASRKNHGELHFNRALREATQLLGATSHLHCPVRLQMV